MLLRMLGSFGIGHCPYTAECGPDNNRSINCREEEIDAEKTCHTL